MTRVKALDIAISLLNAYMSGSPDADEQFVEVEKVLTRMRDSIQKQKRTKHDRSSLYE